jgi:putative restriction endonuclease
MLREDDDLRAAAFAHVSALSAQYGVLDSRIIAKGFEFEGQRVPLANPQQGIFKPRQMRYLLSIRTVIPRKGAKVWYDDQRQVHDQIYAGQECVDYAFMGNDPNAHNNVWLREAWETGIPFIYFLGVAPGKFQAVMPAFIADWDPKSLSVAVTFGDELSVDAGPPSDAIERRYVLRQVKQRLHQSQFREAVLSAYDYRCAISNLPEEKLLDAAHIVSDKDERLGQPEVINGIPLSKVHHAAFDSHLIGIDPDYRLHVSEALMSQNDGPTLEALKQSDGKLLHLPNRERDYPDRERLALRFEAYRRAS